VGQEGTVKAGRLHVLREYYFVKRGGVSQNFDTSHLGTDLAPGLNVLRDKIGHAPVQLAPLLMQRNIQTTSFQTQKTTNLRHQYDLND
jgi:hypothetical protein